jgi:hypothetical protein
MMMPVRGLTMSLVSSPESRLQPGIGDGLVHGDMVPGGAGGVEAHGAAVDELFGVERRRAVNLAAKAQLGVFFGPHDAGPRLAQRSRDFLDVVADRRDNADAGDDDAPHDFTPLRAGGCSGEAALVVATPPGNAGLSPRRAGTGRRACP